ncbi:cyclin-dependent kinase 2-interacting protein-like, partial [Diadema antillarum]|uniref:cyclin-dependent kinase 2-interacting protein-like n=1 Tax=Diadema antillarum TaxID=105358 RepID=UPI003A8B7139
GSRSSQSSQHQLQGSARVIKDHCADWHNHIEKWNTLNDRGLDVINKIINLRLQVKEAEAENVPHGLHAEYPKTDGIPDGVENLCQQLTDIHAALVTLMGKMKAITKHFRGVEQLERKKSTAPEPLFATWSVNKFVTASEELELMYEQELEVKRTIVEDVAHHEDRDTLMTYSSCWLHQPYILDHATIILESMLMETGLR